MSARKGVSFAPLFGFEMLPLLPLLPFS